MFFLVIIKVRGVRPDADSVLRGNESFVLPF